MPSSNLRWLAIVLLLATGLIHIYYGVYFAAATASSGGGYGGGGSSSLIGGISNSQLFYAMGAVYLLGVALLVSNVRPRLFQSLALVYTLLLLAVWVVAGARDTVAYLDKLLEVILVISLVVLISRKTPKVSPSIAQPSP